MSIPDTVPQYRALSPAFLKLYRHVGSVLVAADAEIFYEGTPGNDLMPLNAAAVTAKAQAIRLRRGFLIKNAANQREIFRLAKSVGLDAEVTWDEAREYVLDWAATHLPEPVV